MLATFFTVSSLALLANASPLKRASSLSVSVSGPSEVTSLDNLVLTATVTNSGDETVKMLKYGTVLDDQLPTRSFKASKNGTAVDFTGIKVGSCMLGVCWCFSLKLGWGLDERVS